MMSNKHAGNGGSTASEDEKKHFSDELDIYLADEPQPKQ